MNHAEPSPVQTHALQSIWVVFERDASWPTFDRADRVVYRQANLSIGDVLDEVRPWLVLYDPHGHTSSTVSLTLAGIARCSGTRDILAAVLATVRACVQLERDHEPTGDAPDSDTVTIGPDELRRVLAPHFTSPSPKFLNDVFAVLTSEWIPSSSNGPAADDPDAWAFQVDRSIRRFKHVETLDQLLEATDRTTLPAFSTADLAVDASPDPAPNQPRLGSSAVSHEYFSDRTSPPAGRELDQITLAAWAGVVSLVERGIASALFARDFPERCPDGRGTFACDGRAFSLALKGDIPSLSWPLSEFDMPTTLAALDLVEFCHLHADAPIELDYHGHFGHTHLRFEKTEGQRQLRDDANRLLARNRLAYELGDDGHVRRIAPPVIDDRLAHALPPTRDSAFDDLLERARVKYRDPDPERRGEALEQLWDAFERAKTILNADKKTGAAALIAAAAGTAEEAQLLDTEMRELTRTGNDFRIRHHEATKSAVSDALVDLLFARMYALLYRLHPALR